MSDDAGTEAWLDALNWNEAGLLPAIAQDYDTGDVLTLAWVNRASLRRTLESGYATYWSRSRACLWRKGETSGHLQEVREMRVDCDADALLLLVVQIGFACHTGSWSCFYRRLEDGRWARVPGMLRMDTAAHE